MFKRFILKSPHQLFLTILLPFLLSTVLLLFAQSSFLSTYFEKHLLEMVYNQQKNDLHNTSRNVNAIAKSAKSLAITAFFDGDVKKMLFSSVDTSNFIMYEDKLRSYKFIYPFLQSIYIYNGYQIYANPSKDFAYDRSSFQDQGILSILGDTEHYGPNSFVLRQIPNVLSGITTDADPYVNVYSYLFFESPVSKGKASEAIVLNISEQSIQESISSSDPKNKNRIFIVDHEGKILSKDAKYPLLSNLSEKNYIQAINASEEKNGSLRLNVDGVDSFITYADMDVFDWKLISITPYHNIVKDIEQKKQKTYYFVIGFIIGSIILSFYFSKRLYTPIKSVIQNYNVLELEMKNDFFYKKQQYLRKLIHSNMLIPVEALEQQFQKYRIDLHPLDSARMILIRIDHYSEFCDKFSPSDRNLLKFGLINIVSEMLSPAYKHECVVIEEDQILVVINDAAKEAFRYTHVTLPALAKEIQEKLASFLNLSATFTFSEPFETLSKLNFYYLKTLDLSFYRFILGHRAVITQESLTIQSDEYKYPHSQDKRMTDALMKGQTDEAKQLLDDIIRHASKYSYTILNSVLIQLLLSIRYAIEVVETNHSMKLNFNFNLYFSMFQKIETLEQVQSDFHALFENLAMELESKRGNKYIKLVEDVVAFINKEFADPILSLDTIAERVNLHPEYLRKLFKKHYPVSINELINNVRLEYASARIAFSDDTIVDIIEKSGFLSRSHFFTIFKKTYGVTPNQYRNNARARA